VDRIVVDTFGVLRDSGDAIAARRTGVHDEARVAGLADVVVGRAPGRSHRSEITLFKSVGTSAQDLAVALLAYRRALADGRGAVVEDFVSAKPD
jgi:ornithine cyclodeaminase/alanine dehydrogenase-like protein (mu-crystallin family)